MGTAKGKFQLHLVLLAYSPFWFFVAQKNAEKSNLNRIYIRVKAMLHVFITSWVFALPWQILAVNNFEKCFWIIYDFVILKKL